ncbi:secreted RxLR effector protein 161-like [Tasmannia lanceolata]|uniref:secreted RxLR effector protein 161-like n=1 Tax=Tasmannia lanceolata TaxID=3420 RepID=UPI004063EB7E
MTDFKKGLVPLRHIIRLSKKMSPKTPEDKQVKNNIPYVLAVGSHMYTMLSTRPDVCHSVSVVSKYESDPDKLVVYGFTDVDFQFDVDDMELSLGFVFSLANGAVSWRSCKQDTIADATIEAEYIAASEPTKEVV